MIISKAIELLRAEQLVEGSVDKLDRQDATELGIEALKRIKDGRLHPFNPMYIPLPGETMPDRGIQAVMQSRQTKKTKRA